MSVASNAFIHDHRLRRGLLQDLFHILLHELMTAKTHVTTIEAPSMEMTV